LYENYSHQNKNAKTGGYVNLSFIPSKDTSDGDFDKVELYLGAIKTTVDKLLLKGFSYRDMVILTRKKDPAIKIATFLTEYGIPIVSSETLLLQNSIEVKFVVNVLRYIKNDLDKESKANFLHYVGTYLQESVPVHDFIFQGMMYDFDKELEQWLLTFDLNISFRQLRKKSLYEVVEDICNKLIQSKETNAYLQDFLDRVLEYDIKKRSGISDFLDFWDNNASRFSIPSPEGNNAIRIMTIHKAKGLEFPVVIFPFAEESYSNAPKDKLWIEPENDYIPLDKILVDNNSTVEELGESAKLVYQQKKEEELLDNVNILYVALTRAEEQLYIISSMNLTSKGEVVNNNMSTFFLNYLIENGLFNSSQLNYHWGNQERISIPRKKTQSIQPIERVQNTLDPSAIKIVHKESLMCGTNQQKAIEYGNVIHEILSYVKTYDDVDLALIKAFENGLINRSQRKEVSEVLHKICTHPELICFFASDLTILNEQTIIRKSDSLIKPDRIVLNSKGEAMLVDYKTGEPNSKHQKQIETYQQALEMMGHKVIKKALVYIGETLKIVTL
jgi:ATP-dependent exoDNAse (exonuclease V) beta subunit